MADYLSRNPNPTDDTEIIQDLSAMDIGVLPWTDSSGDGDR